MQTPPSSREHWRSRLGVISLLVFLAFEGAWIGWCLRHDRTVDYYAYDAAAAAMAKGASPYTYEPAPAEALLRQRGINPALDVRAYLYPPFLAALLMPLQRLTAQQAAAVWSLGSLLALTLSAGLLSQVLSRRWLDPRVFGGLVMFVPVMTTFYAGQVNHYLLLSMSAAVWGLDRSRTRLVGLALAAGILLKAIPLALAGTLFLRRRWTSLAWTVLFLALLVAATLCWIRSGFYFDYLEQVLRLSGVGTAKPVPANQSLWATALRVIGPSVGGQVGVALSAAVALSTVAEVLRNSRNEQALLPCIGLVMAGVALAAPLSWIHHQVLLAVPMVVLLRFSADIRFRTHAVIASVFCMLALDLVALAWKHLQGWPWLASSGTWGMLLLWSALYRMNWDRRDQPAAAPAPD